MLYFALSVDLQVLYYICNFFVFFSNNTPICDSYVNLFVLSSIYKSYILFT